MKVLLKNAVIKKILIVLVMIIMVSNFIMPNYVHAAKSAGENLVSGFFYLLADVGDATLKAMQSMMVGKADIKEGGEYSIKYSPGIIFSNTVPAFDINFISPSIPSDTITMTNELKQWDTKSGEFLKGDV